MSNMGMLCFQKSNNDHTDSFGKELDRYYFIVVRIIYCRSSPRSSEARLRSERDVCIFPKDKSTETSLSCMFISSLDINWDLHLVHRCQHQQVSRTSSLELNEAAKVASISNLAAPHRALPERNSRIHALRPLLRISRFSLLSLGIPVHAWIVILRGQHFRSSLSFSSLTLSIFMARFK